MNKHIELVKRWIADKDSVSSQELTDNVDDAVIAAEAASCAVMLLKLPNEEAAKLPLTGLNYTR